MTAEEAEAWADRVTRLQRPCGTGAPHLAGQQEGMLNVGLGDSVNGNASLAVQGALRHCHGMREIGVRKDVCEFSFTYLGAWRQFAID